MSKQTISITIDSDVATYIRSTTMNVSGFCNECLLRHIARQKQDIDGINIEIEKLEKDRALRKLNTWRNKFQEHDDKIKRYEEVEAEHEKMKLEQEKEEIEKLESCKHCGCIYGEKYDKWNKFPIGHICNGCYMAASKEDMEKWKKTTQK